MPVPTGMSIVPAVDSYVDEISLLQYWLWITLVELSTNIITTMFISSAMMVTMSTMVPTTVVASFNSSKK